MTVELQAVVAATAILFVSIAFQGVLVPATHGLKWGLGPRDEPRTPSKMQGRAARVVANHLEAIAMFAPLALVAHAYGVSTAMTHWGAALFVIGRVGFTATYLLGVPAARSAFWGVGMLGTLLIGVALLDAGV